MDDKTPVDNLVPFPARGAHQPLKEANAELDDAIDALFNAVKGYGAAGHHGMAQRVSVHAHALQALRFMRKP